MGVAGVLEIVGGLLLLIGLFTRPTAFVLSGFMAMAYFGYWLKRKTGEKALLFQKPRHLDDSRRARGRGAAN